MTSQFKVSYDMDGMIWLVIPNGETFSFNRHEAKKLGKQLKGMAKLSKVLQYEIFKPPTKTRPMGWA